ncbi:MAG TPA: transketolase, partial [Gammaproteobacteria bacterium]|nr:transketolase [Gammaproteobacteria bacterium]
YPLSMDDLKDFRQLHSKTAGHPEFSECPGVETTTGPLGQGFATAVGMALAEKKLAAEFNLPENPIVDHRTWVMVGDGCLMEGISHEAASLAGTLQLGKLICLYDDNGISIDGDVTGWYSEDVPVRFESYGWRVLRDVDGHNPQAIQHALSQATLASDRPTLVCFKTTIGFGSPNKAGTAAVHGAALGDDEIELTRDQLGWSMPPFEISDDIYAAWNGAARGQQAQQKWQERFAAYAEAEPAKAAELVRRLQKTLPEQWDAPLLTLAQAEQDQPTDLETRKASQRCIGAVAEGVPELFGGSADLTGSNNTRWSEADDS